MAGPQRVHLEFLLYAHTSVSYIITYRAWREVAEVKCHKPELRTIAEYMQSNLHRVKAHHFTMKIAAGPVSVLILEKCPDFREMSLGLHSVLNKVFAFQGAYIEGLILIEPPSHTHTHAPQ